MIRGFFITFEVQPFNVMNMGNKEIDFLDSVLYALSSYTVPVSVSDLKTNMIYSDITKKNYKRIDNIGKISESYFKSALDKLKKDGYADLVGEKYIATFEGKIFIKNDEGYGAKQILDSRAFAKDKMRDRTIMVLTCIASMAGVHSILQIFEFFGYDHYIKCLVLNYWILVLVVMLLIVLLIIFGRPKIYSKTKTKLE